MGGSNSGRWGGRPTVDASPRIELPYLRRRGFLRIGSRITGTWEWSRGGEPYGSVSVSAYVGSEGEGWLDLSYTRDGEPVAQRIRLEGLAMRYGGWRWFARCPFTGRRCTTLVLPNGGHRFASVKGWRLAYASQRGDSCDRAHRRIAKANARLEGMSKYARRHTRQRQWDRIADAEAALNAHLMRVWGRLRRLEARLRR